MNPQRKDLTAEGIASESRLERARRLPPAKDPGGAANPAEWSAAPSAVENTTRMVHVTLPDERYVALCGARLRGVDALDDEPVECLVCTELAAGWDLA